MMTLATSNRAGGGSLLALSPAVALTMLWKRCFAALTALARNAAIDANLIHNATLNKRSVSLPPVAVHPIYSTF